MYMKIKYLLLTSLLFVALSGNVCFAQEDNAGFHKLVDLSLQARADFDFENNLDTHVNNYGFRGRHLAISLKGNLGKHFSYTVRQRLLPRNGNNDLLVNTDFMYIDYHPNDNFYFTLGKQLALVGGFEYDKAPTDSYFVTNFCANFPCYKLGATAHYVDDEGQNHLAFQIMNSPNIQNFNDGLLGYNLSWYGNFNHFKTIYSVNMFEIRKGYYINYIALGNKVEFNNVSFFADFTNRFWDTKSSFFADFSLVAQLDVRIANYNIFVKGGYEQNHHGDAFTLTPDAFPDEFYYSDMTLPYNAKCHFYGIGLEYVPKSYKNIRFYTYCAVKNNDMPDAEDVYVDGGSNVLNVAAGVYWNLDFKKLLKID